MFKRQPRKISITKYAMQALNFLRFFMENDECAQKFGEPLEVDIRLDKNEDYIIISFLTDKDFIEAVEEGLCRPPDTKKKCAVVEIVKFDFVKITLYDFFRPTMGKYISYRHVRKNVFKGGYHFG